MKYEVMGSKKRLQETIIESKQKQAIPVFHVSWEIKFLEDLKESFFQK